VAIIGSGATAITLLPAMADRGAAHVTMVQRTPTYIYEKPESDPVARLAARCLSDQSSHDFMRWFNTMVQWVLYFGAQRWPDPFNKYILSRMWRRVQGSMSKEEFTKHFVPPYNVWDQRLCVVPDGDFYKALRDGFASVVTGHIETFTEDGIQMKDGQHVPAEVIITATGLSLQRNFPMSTMNVTVDGKPYDVREKMTYKSVMLSGVPNFAFTFGYTNASWTLKADIASNFICRVLNHMRDNGFAVCCPQPGPSAEANGRDFLNLSSGYVERAKERMPKQGARDPWRMTQNVIADTMQLRWGRIADPELAFQQPRLRSRL